MEQPDEVIPLPTDELYMQLLHMWGWETLKMPYRLVYKRYQYYVEQVKKQNDNARAY